MTPLDLAHKLAGLEEFPPLAIELDWRCGPNPQGVWYRSQREHWVGHLEDLEYRGHTSAKGAYSRIQNVAMLVWIGAVCQTPANFLAAATADAHAREELGGRGWPARACRSFRGWIPWTDIHQYLAKL